tara:strand:+ start:577 stop:1317 length:741 start_codon:yes stop_codon:yes gene_type:complete
MENKLQFPTEVIDLPSKGLLYPEDSPLSSGKVEMKYMTAREEDILTNVNYLEQGIVIDKLLESLVVSKIDHNELLIGDKNALLIAARVLGYGKDYEIEYLGQPYTVDLSELKLKELDESLFEKGKNEFEFTLPTTNTKIKFKLLTQGDETKINEELKGLQKIDKNASYENTTRLKHMILSVDGDTDNGKIRQFVDNYFLARDSRVFRAYAVSIQPDVDLTFYPEGGPEGGVDIPIGINFLWPDAGI